MPNAYIVTEKIHGANFCIIASLARGTDGDLDIQFAKRTAILGRAGDAEDFYSCRSAGLLRELEPRVCAVFRHLHARDPALAAVHIYGELYGGRYPHAQVAAESRLQPVQIGVWYSPNLQFQAFDVAVETHKSRAFLDFRLARQACESCELKFAAPLHVGTLAECLDFPIEFETTIPARLGLPQIPVLSDGTRNLAEGVVIRPASEPLPGESAPCGGSSKTTTRGLFKRKIEAFSEKKYQNDEWRKGKGGGAGTSSSVGAQELVSYEIAACVTEQRLANVLSKTGHVDPRDKAACRQLLKT